MILAGAFKRHHFEDILIDVGKDGKWMLFEEMNVMTGSDDIMICYIYIDIYIIRIISVQQIYCSLIVTYHLNYH